MRVPAVEPEMLDASLGPLVEKILRLRGSFFNLHKALANSPKGLAAFMGFSEYVRDGADLSPRLRELAVLRVATVHDVAYELGQHRGPARKAGLSEAQLAAVGSWREQAALFDSRERAVLAYVEESARGFRVSDETFLALKQHLSDAEILDLSLVVGWYLLCAAVLVPLEVELEEEFQ